MRMPIILMLGITSLPAHADPAVVVAADAVPGASGWRFDVTISHPETGWDDYADGWRVEAPDGTVLGERPLVHPHVDEQPFTRSLSGVEIPGDLSQVAIRTRTSVEGWSEAIFALSLR